jgi:hypothetical protein
MSPEQIRGAAIDTRSDLFSLGVILYELLSGRRPFARGSAVETMHAILNEEPADLAVEIPSLPPALDRVLFRCLEKDPEDRFQSARDLAFALEAFSDRHTAATEAEPASPRPRSVATFDRLTFRRGCIATARFAPDGRTVLYGAAWDAAPWDVYSGRLGSPESRSLGFRGADILGVSAAGEIALALDRRIVGGFIRIGTLARVSIAGGAPREILDDVHHADWSPDGRSFAIVHDVDGRNRLEYPPGSVLYTSTGWISHLRVSPDGERVAFLDHPRHGNDGGNVVVVDRAGASRTLAIGFASLQGLCWRPGGREIWFTATRKGGARALHAVTLEGQERPVLAVPGAATVQDFGVGGVLLLTHENARLGILARPGADEEERDLSWLDWSLVRSMSKDGRKILFDETGEGGGEEAAVYLRRTDGSPAVRLGEGSAMSLSPDGKWALSVRREGAGSRCILLPTRAGEPRRIAHPEMILHAGQFFLDGRRLACVAHRPDEGPRLYEIDIDSGESRSFTREGIGTFEAVPSPDGRWVAAQGTEHRYALFAVDSGDEAAIPGIEPWDRPIHWTADGTQLYTYRRGAIPLRIEKIDLATGARGTWGELMPGDATGIVHLGGVGLSEDASAYAYSYARILCDLYAVSGLA